MLKLEELKNIKLFAGLNDEALRKIADLCTRKYFKQGSIVFTNYTPASDLYLLEEGNDAIQIEIYVSDEERIVIHTMSKGEPFGWSALGAPHIRTAIARCVEDVKVISIDVNNLFKLLDSDHDTGYLVMKNLAEQISSRLSYTTLAFRNELRILKKLAA